MDSTNKKSKPGGLGRKNTLQRMLDLEQKNKLIRMRASSTSIPRSPPPTRSNPPRQHLPVPLQSIDRAIMAPSFSPANPPPKPATATNGASPKYVVKSSGDLIAQEAEVSDAHSDISSICQSPGWEDYNGKKRKKEKEEERERRRKETGGSNRQLPQEHQVRDSDSFNRQTPKRLSKAPPTNRRLSTMAISTARSVSAPAVPTLPTMARGNVKKEEKKAAPEKPKRSSAEYGLRGFKSATQAIPGPWKSQNSAFSDTPTQEASLPRKSFSRRPGAYNDEGFIGGLKLDRFRQNETATAQQDQHEHGHKKVGWSDGGGEAPIKDRDPTRRGAGNSSSSTSMAESLRPISLHNDSERTPHQWDTVYAQAATATATASRGLASNAKPVEDSTPIMERNIRNNHKSHPPPYSRYFPPENEGSESFQRDSSNGPRQSILSGSRNPDSQPANDRNTWMTEPQPMSDRESRKPGPQPSKPAAPVKKSYPPESRGRADYARYLRQEAESNAVNAVKDESEQADAAASKPRSRRGSFTSLFSRSRSRTRTSNEAPLIPGSSATGASPATKKELPATTSFSTIRGNSKAPKKDADKSGVFLDEEYVLNQLHLELNTKASDSATQSNKRASSKGPSFQGLKSAAKFAFSRHSIATPASSPTGSFATAKESQRSSSKAPSSKRTSLDVTSLPISSPMEADNGASNPTTPPIAHEHALPRSMVPPPRSPARSPARKERELERSSRNPAPKALHGNNNRSSRSRSATDSSEDYSTHDDSSNLTTPCASRPQSQKDYFLAQSDLNGNAEAPVNKSASDLEGCQDSTLAVNDATPVDDAASARFSWCRSSAAELEPAEDEETPTETNAAFDFTTTHVNNSSPQVPQLPQTPPTESVDLHRKPSISRSFSTPELQDLSFLPTLKHQALTRASKGQEKATHTKTTPIKNPKQPSGTDEEAAAALVRPIPISTTKCEGSSPTLPQSSQYLHNARLSIAGARSPSQTSFPPGPHHQNGPDPIAKMFVVCCKCKYFHDMPSKIYECMTKPDNVVTDSDLGVSGVISTSVKCPWCRHGMRTSCCAGYAAVVYLSEKLH